MTNLNFCSPFQIPASLRKRVSWAHVHCSVHVQDYQVWLVWWNNSFAAPGLLVLLLLFFTCVCVGVFLSLQCWLKSPLAQHWHNTAPYTLNLCVFARKTTAPVAANEVAAFKSTFCLFCLLLCSVTRRYHGRRRHLTPSYQLCAILSVANVQIVCSAKLDSANLRTLGGLCRALAKSYTEANICRQIRPNIHKPGLVHRREHGCCCLCDWNSKLHYQEKHIKSSVDNNLVLFWTRSN